MSGIPRHTRSTSVEPLFSGDELPVIKRARKPYQPTIITIPEVKLEESPSKIPSQLIIRPLQQSSTSTATMAPDDGGAPIPLDEASLNPIQREQLLLLREQRQQQKAEHEARLAGISKPAEESSSSTGEPPSPQVLETSRILLGVDVEVLVDILKNKFKPEHLYKLRPIRDISTDLPSSRDIEIIGDTITVGKARGDYKEFKNTMSIWSEGFIYYAGAINLLHKGFKSELIPSMLMFHERVRRLDAIYPWTQVIRFAIAHHSTLAQNALILSASSWRNVPTDSVHLYCTTPKPTPSLRVSTPQLTTSARVPWGMCMDFNKAAG
ncbi:hypothetical protein MMC14_004584, partial [Varicellaria rhodocarpa]|nr:hypothetical protein [Varicellaria rhodocarpa]